MICLEWLVGNECGFYGKKTFLTGFLELFEMSQMKMIQSIYWNSVWNSRKVLIGTLIRGFKGTS